LKNIWNLVDFWKFPIYFFSHTGKQELRKRKQMCDTFIFYFCHSSLHTRNIFSLPECLKSQKIAFHFLGHCLYSELPPSADYSACWQWSAFHGTSWLTSMLFSCNSFSTRSTVSFLGCWLRNDTWTYTASRLQAVVRFKNYTVELTKLWLMTILVFLPSAHLPSAFPLPAHFPVFPPSLINFRYTYKLWL